MSAESLDDLHTWFAEFAPHIELNGLYNYPDGEGSAGYDPCDVDHLCTLRDTVRKHNTQRLEEFIAKRTSEGDVPNGYRVGAYAARMLKELDR